MAQRPEIIQVTDQRNYSELNIRLSAPPTGELKLYGARMPDGVPVDYGVELSYTEEDDGTYTATIPEQYVFAGDTKPALLWYITAHDDGGYSCIRDQHQEIMGACPVWMGMSETEDIDEIMLRLRRRIKDNQSAIEARMRIVYPAVTLKQVLYGLPANVEEYPAVHLSGAALHSRYAGSDYYREGQVEANIFGYIAHPDPTIEERVSLLFGRSVQRILTQRGYETMTLSSGMKIVGCQCGDIQFNDYHDGERFLVQWSTVWSGMMTCAEP